MAGLRKALPPLITLAVVALALVLGFFAWTYYTRAPWTRDARVRADVVTVSADVTGRIVELRVKDNQHVSKGDLLLSIDPARYELAVLHADRAVEVARAALGQSQAAIAANQALLRQRQSEEVRRKALKARSAISNEEWEKAHTDVTVAEAQLLREQANLGLAQANVSLAEAAQKQARLDLERTQVVAPVNGYVTNLLTRAGDYATAGHSLVALVDSDSFYVGGYFEETKLPHIRPGDRADIRLMSGGHALRGTVEGIARGITDADNPTSSSDLLATVSPTFNWIRLAQRVPVRVRIDPASVPKDTILAAGMTASVTVHPGTHARN